jgi:hypothetical protein
LHHGKQLCGGTLNSFAGTIKGKQTVKILCRELAKLRQPSDMTKERGDYDRVSKVKSQGIEDHKISFKYLLVVRSARSCTKFKLYEQEEEKYDERVAIGISHS